MSGPALEAEFNYQSAQVPCSLTSTGKVYVDRATTGSDTEPVGLDELAVKVPVYNARIAQATLDDNGFQLVKHRWDHVDYYDEEQLLQTYYPEVCALIKVLSVC